MQFSDDELTRLDELATKATQGIWERGVNIMSETGTIVAGDEDIISVEIWSDPIHYYMDDEDIDYIVAAQPSTVRRLIGEIRQLRAQLRNNQE